MEQCDALVVHDDQNLRDSLHQAFRAAGYKSVLEANDGGEGLEAFRRARPSLVVTDITTPIAGGLDLLRQIRQEEPDTAVIVLSSRPDAKTAIASLKLGAFAFLPKPVNLEEFLITAQRALERRQLLIEHRSHQKDHGPLQDARARNVLIVDDERAVRDVLRQIFETAGYTCRFSGDGYKGLEMFKAWRPSLVVTDIKHPGLSACELLREVRAVDDDVAVIVLTAASEAKTVVSLLKLGADAFLMKPMIVDELLIVSERALERRQLLSERRKRQDSP